MNLLNAVKEEIEAKRNHLTSHSEGISSLRSDIVRNYNNIVVSMQDDHFDQIIKKYSLSVDNIQKQYEDLKLETYASYEEIMEHPRKMEKINTSLQVCLSHIQKLFENCSTIPSVTVSLYSSHVEGNAFTPEDMKKINECFYPNTSNIC